MHDHMVHQNYTSGVLVNESLDAEDSRSNNDIPLIAGDLASEAQNGEVGTDHYRRLRDLLDTIYSDHVG
jgi:hypothetical protein